jgi:low affinity Fe/Cu permease
VATGDQHGNDDRQFLMVFLIQHTQNCDSAAVHIKLDEKSLAVKGADNTILIWNKPAGVKRCRHLASDGAGGAAHSFTRAR